ncbi:MAG TPA: hypothetical protein VK280_30650, partial [Streptosporangiaceae bacterium]|nr:hypothetical protein [Streptosporangiaceae bacterium]
GHGGGVGVARAPAAALGEHDDGQPLAAGQLEQPVGLAVVLDILPRLKAGDSSCYAGWSSS